MKALLSVSVCDAAWVGKVARLGGQQRIVVEVKGVCLVSTAYVPSVFLEKV